MLWDEVLTALGQSRGYVSGAELSRRFGVTRAGIHVTVERLREAGYEIVSARKRGYRLLGGPDSLGIGDLAMHLPKERLAAVRCLKEVNSTNRYLKELAEEGLPEGFTVIADKQTKGRGRYGRFFASPAGDGLYLSMLLRNAGDPGALSDVTAYAAVATAKAIRRVTGRSPDLLRASTRTSGCGARLLPRRSSRSWIVCARTFPLEKRSISPLTGSFA